MIRSSSYQNKVFCTFFIEVNAVNCAAEFFKLDRLLKLRVRDSVALDPSIFPVCDADKTQRLCQSQPVRNVQSVWAL